MTKHSDSTGLGIFERAMFSFMGPPQIGEHTVREDYVPDASADVCHKCNQPWTEHERVHTSAFAYRRCATPRT